MSASSDALRDGEVFPHEVGFRWRSVWKTSMGINAWSTHQNETSQMQLQAPIQSEEPICIDQQIFMAIRIIRVQRHKGFAQFITLQNFQTT